MPEDVRHLYIHIPFCPSKCSYCAFVTHIGSLKLVEPYLTAVENELRMVAAGRLCAPLRTVYVGGGTPTMLTPIQVSRLLDTVREVVGIEAGAELTLEGHPATVDDASLAGFRSAGINRISFGGESLQEDELVGLGRVHGARTVTEVVRMSREAGFADVNLDFMYGIPGQTLHSWERTLDTALSIGPDHLSLYPLSVEPNTVFARRLRQDHLLLPDDDLVAAMYHLACRMLAPAGYQHYEVANWARPGRRARHNLAYWHDLPYYGVGVGAHAYLGGERTENMRGVRAYIERLKSGQSPVVHREAIDADTALTETMILGLRLLDEGVDLDGVGERLQRDVATTFAGEIDVLRRAGLIEVEGRRILLAEESVPVANAVWERFVLSGS